MLVDAVCCVQNVLHRSNSLALPLSLLLASSGLVVYRHAVDEEQRFSSDPLKTFLFLIMLQMLPLVFLEMKVMSCPDPIALLMRFGPKVMLMHISFLAIRVFSYPYAQVGNFPVGNVIGFIAACMVLMKGFRMQFSLSFLWDHRDVFGLTLLTFLAGGVTSMMEGELNLKYALDMATSYAEVCAFVPAVRVVYQPETYSVMRVNASDPRIGAISFFAFLASFYLLEDVGGALNIMNVLPLAAAGHMVHYLLLLDFAGFVLGRVISPEKLKGQLQAFIPM